MGLDPALATPKAGQQEQQCACAHNRDQCNDRGRKCQDRVGAVTLTFAAVPRRLNKGLTCWADAVFLQSLLTVGKNSLLAEYDQTTHGRIRCPLPSCLLGCCYRIGPRRLFVDRKGGHAGAKDRDRAAKRPRTSERRWIDYVAAPDTNYSYHLVNTFRGQDQTTYILEMTSQAWLTTNEVDRPLWKHWLTIVRPDAVASSKALLFISGGANDGRVPKSADGNLIRIALATKSVVAELKMVPNQPLVFAGETEGRKEDSLIAYTWDKFLRTGDPKWPARLPMTKAAVRAMDTVTAFCASSGRGQGESGWVCRGGRIQARLDDLDDRGGGQARGGDHSHRD